MRVGMVTVRVGAMVRMGAMVRGPKVLVPVRVPMVPVPVRVPVGLG
ncbi:hypothetical protein HCN51_18225 [Nonomuraea sp. FMUSA5-5]|uniref:Uncharacterized protein n=1 Tax=Nonomuraea composti TaxID=2720023 RepID=A0ABX1B0J3_9ACTN|nr:hypothetical protein [Nonomuraea sp. FMUSA5-5]NJP91373.1 hypothetical protein [Nonomuraea sp. FMUSA5-5]